MAAPHVATAEPLIQEGHSSRSFDHGRGRVVLAVGCAMLFAAQYLSFVKDNQHVATSDPAINMQVMQPIHQGRRAILSGFAALPLFASADQALADKDRYIDELLKRSKDNTAKNNAERAQRQQYNMKNFYVVEKGLKDVKPPPAIDIAAKVKSDFKAAEVAGKP